MLVYSAWYVHFDTSTKSEFQIKSKILIFLKSTDFDWINLIIVPLAGLA